MKTHYELLGIEPTASPEDIKASYLRAISFYHPDRNKSKDAIKMTQLINEAYDVLKDPQKKKEYDSLLTGKRYQEPPQETEPTTTVVKTNIEKSKICSFCDKTSTDLQCSKTGCENYICPSCLEQTPVGARCPDCAQMKKNPLYDPSNKELVFSAFAGILVSTLSGIIFSLIINFTGKIILPGFIILLIPLAAIGYLTGITIERTSKFKKSTSLQIIAGISTLVGSIIYSNVFLFSIPGLIGLILGIYLAIYRIRP